MADSVALDAPGLREAFRVAAEWLARNRDHINAINVYPVPDGDTGTNMLLTVRAAIEGADTAIGDPLGLYTGALALGALLGARGNSGVILSQMIRGFAEAVSGIEAIDGIDLQRALQAASDTAYAAVSEPVEGTMLTVMRAAAEEAAAASPPTLAVVLRTAEEAAARAVERTPEQLPRLREAGVVDSGGLGVAVILAGLRMGVLGDPLPDGPAAAATAVVEFAAVQHEGHGYCTEYILEGTALDRELLIASLTAAGGESVLVVGDAATLHVHVHVPDPGPALSAGAALGSLRGVKVDNMQTQHEAWTAGHEAAVIADRAGLPALGLVAVAAGPGLAEAFRAFGAVPVLTADGAKPSAGDLLAAARSAGRDHVLLLPNDKDVLMAAEQAAATSGGFVTVVPTRNVAAGLSAALAYSPDDDADAVAAAMRDAATAVRSVEVTSAARAAQVDGIAVNEGDPIALVDGTLVARAESLEEALIGGISAAGTEDTEIVTVYLGADAPPGARALIRARIERAYPKWDVEVIDGGQPYYPYIAGVE